MDLDALDYEAEEGAGSSATAAAVSNRERRRLPAPTESEVKRRGTEFFSGDPSKRSKRAERKNMMPYVYMQLLIEDFEDASSFMAKMESAKPLFIRRLNEKQSHMKDEFVRYTAHALAIIERESEDWLKDLSIDRFILLQVARLFGNDELGEDTMEQLDNCHTIANNIVYRKTIKQDLCGEALYAEGSSKMPVPQKDSQERTLKKSEKTFELRYGPVKLERDVNSAPMSTDHMNRLIAKFETPAEFSFMLNDRSRDSFLRRLEHEQADSKDWDVKSMIRCLLKLQEAENFEQVWRADLERHIEPFLL